MKRLLLPALLLATACDRGEQAAAPPPAPVRPATGPVVTQADAARLLQEKAAAGLRAILADPDDARYAELRPGTAGAVCGRIDTKQPDGKRTGFRPFVVTPEGVGVISLTPTVMLNDPEDIFPDYHIRWCATPEELVRLEVAPDLNAVASVTDVPADLPELAGLPVPAPTTPPAPETPAAPQSPPPATTDNLESFSKAVLRPDQSSDQR
jgi:hypothetical protein